VWKALPIAFATAVLLGLLWVNAFVAMLGKVARQVLGWSSGAISQTGVVSVVELVASGHYPDKRRQPTIQTDPAVSIELLTETISSAS
jgi:hypothetical protein